MNDKMAIFIFSVNVINRLLLSFLVLTKVITFSGVHCIRNHTVFDIYYTPRQRNEQKRKKIEYKIREVLNIIFV